MQFPMTVSGTLGVEIISGDEYVNGTAVVDGKSDIVFIKDLSVIRQAWVLRRIIPCFKGRPGLLWINLMSSRSWGKICSR